MVFSQFWDSPWKKSYMEQSVASFTDQRECKICNENFEFCTMMYTRSTMNGIEFVLNNQTVLILLLLVKTVCGIDLLSFKVHANPINSLFARREKMSHKTSHRRFTDVVFVFRVRICVSGSRSRFVI